MEHDLPFVEHLVHRLPASLQTNNLSYVKCRKLGDLSVHGVQPSFVTAVLTQVNPLAQHVQEIVHRRAVAAVPKEAFLGDLAVPLVDQAKLVVVNHNMLVIGHNQL